MSRFLIALAISVPGIPFGVWLLMRPGGQTPPTTRSHP